MFHNYYYLRGLSESRSSSRSTPSVRTHEWTLVGYFKFPKFLGTLNFQNQLRNKPHLHIKGANASVTFALWRVYDARTMSKSPFPYRLRRETLRSSYGFKGIVASTILFNSAQWQIWKNRKPVARRQITVTLYDPRTGTARWSWGQRRVLDCHLGPKLIVHSCDSRKEPARSPYDAFAGPIKWYGHRTVILR